MSQQECGMADELKESAPIPPPRKMRVEDSDELKEMTCTILRSILHPRIVSNPGENEDVLVYETDKPNSASSTISENIGEPAEPSITRKEEASTSVPIVKNLTEMSVPAMLESIDEIMKEHSPTYALTFVSVQRWLKDFNNKNKRLDAANKMMHLGVVRMEFQNLMEAVALATDSELYGEYCKDESEAEERIFILRDIFDKLEIAWLGLQKVDSYLAGFVMKMVDESMVGKKLPALKMIEYLNLKGPLSVDRKKVYATFFLTSSEDKDQEKESFVPLSTPKPAAVAKSPESSTSKSSTHRPKYSSMKYIISNFPKWMKSAQLRNISKQDFDKILEDAKKKFIEMVTMMSPNGEAISNDAINELFALRRS